MTSPARAYAETRGIEALSEADTARLETLLAVGAKAEHTIDELVLASALARVPTTLASMTDDDVHELVLALACDRGDPEALRAIDRAYGPAVDAALVAMKLEPDVREEVWQIVKAKLLVAEDGPIRLLSYAGRGTLRGLLKVTATRTALTLLRDARRERPTDAHAMDEVAGASPELDFVKVGARTAFREAFAEAIDTLDPHARNLLRLHHLRRVSLESLATMYGVHRATIVRQLAAARAQVERETGKALRARLDLERGEVEGVIDLVRSHFDASVERLLKTRP